MSKNVNGRAYGRASILALAGAGLSAALTTGILSTGAPGWVARAGNFEAVHSSPSTGAVPASSGYADLVAKVAPSIVTVRSERMVSPAELPLGNGSDLPPFLRQFGFGPQDLRPRREGGLGSGVIVREDGYILTNHHVVNGAQRVKVDLSDRRTLEAKVVGSDPPSDLAVLKVEAQGLPAVSFGDSDAARVGDVVLAFGNPLGIGQTVTMGIVSAKSRATGLGDGGFEDFLQTDAPINQGNSGGALVNTGGQLVGINTQIVSPSGGNIGIGFAIPSRMAETVMTELVNEGQVRRGQLGVTVQGITSDLARSLGLSDVRGALVSGVSPDSPAAKAGIERGDVIVSVDGASVVDGNSLRNRIAGTRPGTRVAVGLLRDGKQKTVQVPLAELRAAQAKDEGNAPAEGGRLGLRVRPVSPGEARELGVESKAGLLVAEVDPSGPAAAAGLRPGDVIEQVNRRSVKDAAELRAAVKASGEAPALVLVNRKEGSVYLTLEPPKA